MKCNVRAAAVASLLVVASVANVARGETPAPQGVLGLSANASTEVAKDVLSVTFSTTREGSDAKSERQRTRRAGDSGR